MHNMQHTDSKNWKSSSVHVIIQNQLKDRSVIQLYVKATGVYLGLKTVGGVVGITNPDSDLSEYCKTRLIVCNTPTHLTLSPSFHSSPYLLRPWSGKSVPDKCKRHVQNQNAVQR